MFQYVFYFGFDLFNKHVEKDFLQHGLGTPYSNSACFDKDDIWNFCSFLYSACQLHYFSPSPWIELYSKLVLGHPRPVIEVSTKTFHPQGHIFFQVFEKKKSDKENILYLMEVDETVVIASVFYFSIVDEHAKIICIGTARGLYLIKRQQTCKSCVLLWFNFTGTVCEKELITSSNNKGYCHRKCFFLVLMKMKLIYYIFVSFI